MHALMLCQRAGRGSCKVFGPGPSCSAANAEQTYSQEHVSSRGTPQVARQYDSRQPVLFMSSRVSGALMLQGPRQA